MRMLFASMIALEGMASVALASDALMVNSNNAAGPVPLTDGQMDQVKAGDITVIRDGDVVYSGPVRPCVLDLLLCNNNNQQSNDGSNTVGDFTIRDVDVIIRFD